MKLYDLGLAVILVFLLGVVTGGAIEKNYEVTPDSFKTTDK